MRESIGQIRHNGRPRGRRQCLSPPRSLAIRAVRVATMKPLRETMGSVVGGVAVAAALAFFALTHEPAAPIQPEQTALNIPTIEQMCTNLGATDGQALMDCQALESSAGEFVVAWMGLNGYIADGRIDIEQIQTIATLDDNNAVDPLATFDPTIDPGLVLDPTLDPSFDPSISDPDPGLGGVTDPNTGETSPVFASPAQLALYCLSGAVDWVSLEDCISINDPTVQLSGVP